LPRRKTKVFLSSASVWENSDQDGSGRLVFPIERFDEIVRTLGFDTLPILPVHAVAAGRLPLHHADPFDRMLIAQATVENLIAGYERSLDRAL